MTKRQKTGKFFLKIGVTLLAFLSLSTYQAPQVQALDWLLGEEASEDTLTDEDLQTIVDVYNTIQELYIEDVDKATLMEGALKGMVGALEDPYSEYLNVQESESMNESVEGSFTGIGVQFIQRNGEITVVTPIDGTPAKEAGIQPNDVFLQADGVELTNMDTNEVVNLIRGEIGTEVELLIRRGNSEFTVNIVRAEIPIITVEGELYADNQEVGIVQLTQFNSTTFNELVEVVEDLRSQGATSFIFDLRYNPGGLLDQALEISNIFLDEGDIIMHMEQYGETTSTYPADNSNYGDFKITEPYGILINNGSASASEIVAAAVKENTDAPILGTTSFGKGSVQTITTGSQYGELKLTFARWLTPSQTWIHDEGVEADVEITPHPVTTSLIQDEEEVLALGDVGEYVSSIAAVLNALGYDIDAEQEYYDADMQAAVEAFQADEELEVTGEVTGETATIINDRAREYINENDRQLDEAVQYLLDSQAAEDQAA